jgi:predicted AlkP superfamily phosphohydrolase/phosphomutase
VRYLRMLSNSLAAASLAACYVLILVLQLNPSLSLDPARLAPLAEHVGGFYALNLTALFYALLVARQMLAPEPFSPAWVSVRELLWMCALAAMAGAVLMWTNLQTFVLVLEPPAVAALEGGAVVLSSAAALLGILSFTRSRFDRPGRFAWAAALVGVVAASVAMPLWIRGRGVPLALEARPIDTSVDVDAAGRRSRLVIIAMDAASLDFITSATAEGRLPNFGRILDAGAVMRLATIRPTSAEAVWAAVATGKLPQKNGVRAAADYRVVGAGEPIELLPDFCFAHGLVRLGLLIEDPHTSATLRTRPLWTILTTLGATSGVVGWPLTQPAPVVRGFLVSDAFPRLAGTPSGIEGSASVFPPDLEREAVSALDDAGDSVGASVVPASTGAEDTPVLGGRFDEAARIDRASGRIAEALARREPPLVTMVRYQSLDLIGHYFLRYATPSEFGDVSEEERRRLGRVLERHYALIDQAIGRAIATLGSDDMLLVLSPYGMEPLGLARRLVERLIGDPDVTGTHDRAPDGFLLAYGASAARGRLRTRASIVDVVPTALYFLGLPIGRDMDGYARTDLFQRSFTDDRPITFIPTYDR